MTDLVVLVGPTSSGKTRLGVALAEHLGGEVISADAFAVYRGMDIGTAKPEPVLRARVPHHLIDIADPRERYSAGMFLRDADAAIAGVRERGKLPIVVGGTLFYVRSLLWGLFPEPPKDAALRRQLEEAWRADPDAVRARLAATDPEAAARIAPSDRQRVLRALEVSLVAGRPMSELWREHPLRRPRYRFVLLGMAQPRQELHARIAQRVESMFREGLLTEVAALLARGVAPDSHAMKAIGYRECCRVLSGEWTPERARGATVVATRQLAKRQLTWLRGESDVEWVEGDEAGVLAQALSRVEASGGSTTGSNQDQR